MNHDAMLEALLRAMEENQGLPAHALAHVETCATCGPQLDRLLAGERVLEGVDGLSQRALESLEASVMASVLPAKTRQWAWPAWLRWSIPMLATAGAVLFFTRAPVLGDGLQVRGGGVEDLAPSATARLLCVGRDGVRGDVTTSMPGPRHLPCGLEDVLGFTLSADARATARHVFLVGVGVDGAPRWYHPRPGEEQGPLLPEGAVTNQVLAGVRLQVNHAPGTTRVLAIFSKEALPLEDVRTALASGNLRESLPAGTTVEEVELDLE